MSESAQKQITELIQQMADGKAAGEVVNEILPLVYDDLRNIAVRVRGGGAPHSLNPTALVHEAYARLVGSSQTYDNRLHFMRVAAIAMRQLLSNYARDQRAERRGGARQQVTLTVGIEGAADEAFDLVSLHDALERLGELNERQARIVELRYFSGLSVAETGECLGIAERTVALDWQMARAWLSRALASAD